MMKKVILICLALIITTGLALAQDESSRDQERTKKDQYSPKVMKKKRAVKQKMKALAKISKLEKQSKALKEQIKKAESEVANLSASERAGKEAEIAKAKKKLEAIELKMAKLRAKHMQAKST